MAFKEAKEQFGEMLRWTPEPKQPGEKTIFLGDVVEGFYVNSRDNVGPNGSTVYELKLSDGRLVSFWGSDLLDGKFNEIPRGCMVRVSNKGIAQPKKPGGRQYRSFMVEFDADTKIPLTEATGGGTSTPSAAPVAAPGQANNAATDEGY